MNDKDIPLANSKVLYRTLLREEGYGVAQTTVLVGGETLWHRHTNVNDRFTVIRGVLTVETKIGDMVEKIEVHDYYSIDPGVTHHVKNETDDIVVYITVQSGGIQDIVLTPTEGLPQIDTP
ncbi:cupin domain-containing protein [Paraburkholderia sp.]|jgi:quercetin dioxygenase-like cupin family protein|uniref:cupin domain-containing protein n=1 Tax=Paraburkholderia sp. TaxID=1926495 RepID=UPI0026206D45|nr:cupin domain-containing protein [Paraburkholderia sp.]